MSDSLVVVIGAGWVGLPLAVELAATHRVVACVHSEEHASKMREEHGQVLTAVATCDVTDAESLKALKASLPEHNELIVVQCVASGGGDVAHYRRIYLDGATFVERELAPNRWILASSTSVFAFTDGRTCDDDAPRAATSEKAEILIAAEDVALAHPNAAVARFAGLYGRDRNYPVRAVRSGRAVIEREPRLLNYVHGDDAVSALALLVRNADAKGAFNIVDNGNVTQQQCYEFIAKQLGLDSPPLGERVETSRAYTNKEVVGSKLRQLGWQPKFATVIDGLREML